MAEFRFLGRELSIFRGDGITRCDRMSDDELVEEISHRYKRNYEGRACVLFTADPGFYDVAWRVLRKKTKRKLAIFVVILPLCGKDTFPRAKVIKCLQSHIVPFVKRMYYRSIKKA